MRTILLLLLLLSNLVNAQENIVPALKGEYLGQKPPGLVPEIFAPELISGKGRLHCFPTFSADLKQILWIVLPPKIMTMREVVREWTPPEPATFSTEGNNQAPFISAENSIYFASSRAGGKGALDIWYTTKEAGSFSIPQNMGVNINTDKSESHPTLSQNNTLFYTGFVPGKLFNRGIYCSNYEQGEYQTPLLLPEPINIMDPRILDYTPFISPDESYLLFCSNRQNPEQELCHIYIAFKNKNGNWEEPVDLSLKMNFTQSSKFPYISPDNKYLFFSSGENFYWVSTDAIKKIKKTATQ
ncbi:MAG: hypothetical protein DRP58_06850 [Spirochaetes bacterium]|nr:MAG: hypothetical protein DRP58_06850 [Spirochaetota bacterium]